MEGRVAQWYTTNTGKSPDEFKALAHRVSSEMPPGARVQEIAPRPGSFAIQLAKLGDRRVVGLDISHTFVEIPLRNAQSAGVQVDFRLGNASRMPFENESFDFLLCRAAFKNFADPIGAIRASFRVLKPGGKGWDRRHAKRRLFAGDRSRGGGNGFGLFQPVLHETSPPVAPPTRLYRRTVPGIFLPHGFPTA